MQAVETSEIERAKVQLRALQAWIRDLNVENAALRRRLLEHEAAVERPSSESSRAA